MLRLALPVVCTALAACSSAPHQPAPQVAAAPEAPRVAAPSEDGSAAGLLDMGFVRNDGQLDPRARFSWRRGASSAYATDTGFALQFVAPRDDIGGANLLFTFEGAADGVQLSGDGERAGRVHVYRDEHAFVQIPSFDRVHYTGLYDGVDLRLRDHDGRLEYDLLLEPGVDASTVVVHCDGARSLSVADDGRLLIETDAGLVSQSIPATWERTATGEQLAREARFRVIDAEHFGFDVPDREPAHALVIDPDITFSSFLGGINRDEALTVEVGADGKVYLAGLTGSPDFPVSGGAFQRTQLGLTDAFVAKVDLDSGAIDWATFLGGTDAFILQSDTASDVAVDAAGNVFVTGWAPEGDFPTTTGAHAEVSAGGVEAFVARFGTTGTLTWSTFLGGADNDFANAIALKPNGDVVVTGHTFSDGAGATAAFPTTAGAYDESFNSVFFSNDAFASCLSADGTTLVWSTLLGGSLRDEATDIVADGSGDLYLSGFTRSSDYPSTVGAYDETFNSGTPNESDAFVAKLSADGSTLAWSTFLGGVDDVEAQGIALGAAGLHVTGRTVTGDFPTTTGAFQETFGGGSADAFVTQLALDGTAILWSSLLGGTGDECGLDLAIDGAGATTLVGVTTSTDFPAGQQTNDATANGLEDGFLAKLDGPGGKLLFSSYYGAADNDTALGVGLDLFGAAVIAGRTTSAGLTQTSPALQPGYGGDGDGFVARLELPPFSDRGFGQAGTGGIQPLLVGTGSLEPLSAGALTISGALASSVGILFIGFSENPAPFKQGFLVPVPFFLDLTLPTFGGTLPLAFAEWPAGIPAGFQFIFQFAISDPVAPGAVSMTNALRAITP